MLASRAADEDETPECNLVRRLENDFEAAVASGSKDDLQNAIMLLSALFVTLKGWFSEFPVDSTKLFSTGLQEFRFQMKS